MAEDQVGAGVADEVEVDVCKFISKIGKKGLIKAAVKHQADAQ